MIEIGCIGDGEYIRHTGVMLRSAFSHCGHDPVRAHILHCQTVSEYDTQCLYEIAESFNAALHFHQIDLERIEHLPDGYFPRSVWLRFLLPELLLSCDKVLYLDSDLIVCDDLRELWESPLHRYPIAAVCNPFYPFMPDHPSRLGISRAQDYLNSGVLLMDLKKLRRLDLETEIAAFIRQHPFADFPDQDALNWIFKDNWLHLHPRWNAQSPMFEIEHQQLCLPPAEIKQAVENPAIVHFIGPFKPWQYLCRHPMQTLYFEHARHTVWGLPALQGKTLENFLLRKISIQHIDAWFDYKRRGLALIRRISRKIRLLAGWK